MNAKKIRLDNSIVDKGLVGSRNRARTLIMSGKVLVNNQPVSKPGTFIKASDSIDVKDHGIPFASRGGIKLEAALQAFEVDVSGLECLDVGASTGGFTDCLLQNGASHVYAVDVGYGQLAWHLRNDARVTVIERANIRYLPPERIPSPLDITVIDVSFISLKIVVLSVLKFLKGGASIIALIKPQFEVGKGKIGKGGVVRDTALHTTVIEDLTSYFQAKGLRKESIIPSPITGPKGNKEFFIHLKYSNIVRR